MSAEVGSLSNEATPHLRTRERRRYARIPGSPRSVGRGADFAVLDDLTVIQFSFATSNTLRS
ncbi:MAG: hypothetical protein WA446_16115 [Steroidobacteraceae bacterium]